MVWSDEDREHIEASEKRITDLESELQRTIASLDEQTDVATLAIKVANEAKSERDKAMAWDDGPLPEDEEIRATHPTRTHLHETYGEAMRLVGATRSKGKLVDLVNWLLVERDKARSEAETAKVCEAFITETAALPCKWEGLRKDKAGNIYGGVPVPDPNWREHGFVSGDQCGECVSCKARKLLKKENNQ